MDVTEIIAATKATIFPDVQYITDSNPRCCLDPFGKFRVFVCMQLAETVSDLWELSL